MNRSLFDLKVGTFISIFIFLIVLFLSIGFSSFEDKLEASDIAAIVRVNADVRVTGISIDKLNNEALSVGENYNKTKVLGEITLPNDNSEVVYDVSITNFGNVEMGLRNITGYKIIWNMKFLDLLKEKILYVKMILVKMV